MGPNSFRLLDELIRRCPEDVKVDRGHCEKNGKTLDFLQEMQYYCSWW